MAVRPGLTWDVDSGVAGGCLIGWLPSDPTRGCFITVWQPGRKHSVLLSHLLERPHAFLSVTGVVLPRFTRSSCTSSDAPCTFGSTHPSRHPATRKHAGYTWRSRSQLISSMLASDSGATCGLVYGWREPVRFSSYQTPATDFPPNGFSLWHRFWEFWRHGSCRAPSPLIQHYARRTDTRLWRLSPQPSLWSLTCNLWRGSETPVNTIV